MLRGGQALGGGAADLDLAARRIAWLKFLSAGQVCISAEHLFVDPELMGSYLAHLALWNDQLLQQKRKYDEETGQHQKAHITNAKRGQIQMSFQRPQGLHKLLILNDLYLLIFHKAFYTRLINDFPSFSKPGAIRPHIHLRIYEFPDTAEAMF